MIPLINHDSRVRENSEVVKIIPDNIPIIPIVDGWIPLDPIKPPLIMEFTIDHMVNIWLIPRQYPWKTQVSQVDC